MEEFIKNVLVFIFGSAAVILLQYIRVLPSFHRDMLHDKRKFKNTKELQIESYFRQQGGNELLELFKEWTAILFKDSKAAQITSTQYSALAERTMLFGSDRTIRILAKYQHFIYSEDAEADHYGDTTIVYIALIISSLKSDFTGYNVNPIDILQIKINDVDDNQPFVDNKISEIKKDVGWE